jgi:hypothetical protein
MLDLEDFLTTTPRRGRRQEVDHNGNPTPWSDRGQPRAATTQSPEGPLAGGGLMEVKRSNSSMKGGSCR